MKPSTKRVILSVNVVGSDGKTIGNYQLTGGSVWELCQLLAQEQNVPETEFVELSWQDKTLWPMLPLESQGIVGDGEVLTMVKTAAKPVAGIYSVNQKDYPEDRYSCWEEIHLLEDNTVSFAEVSAGTGRM
ncbi:unnamed protein product, partial [Symbiodinium natans]